MKKIISMLVVLAMLMTMAPMVFAAETTEYQEVTIPAALELAQENNDTKYLVRGIVAEVVDSTKGSMYIVDANTNALYIAETVGEIPQVGSEVLLLGVLNTNNGDAQMVDARVQTMEAGEGAESNSVPLGNTDLKVSDYSVQECTYVAEQDGTLYITIRAFFFGTPHTGDGLLSHPDWAQLLINGEQIDSFQETVEVVAGDVVTITLKSADGDTYQAWINLSYEGFYVEPLGSALKPVVLQADECPVETIEIPAGETVHYELNYDTFCDDHTLYVYGEDAYIIYSRYDSEVGGMVDVRADAVDGVVTYFLSSYSIQIGNAGSEPAVFTVDCGIPVGSYANPEELTEGKHNVTMLEGNYGYYFDLIADFEGTMTITVTGDSYWAFSLGNEGAPSDWDDDVWVHAYEREGDENTATINVKKGDYITMTLRLQDEDYANCAGDLVVEVVYNAKTTNKLGDVNGDGFVDVEDAMLILQLDAMLLEEDELDMSAADVSGDGFVDVEDAMLVLQFDAMLIEKFPAADENTEGEGAELELGFNEVEVADDQVVDYTWTATEDGLFVLSVMSENWAYTINGVTRTSADETPVYVTVLKVSAGDVVTLSVGTADGTAGVVGFNATTYAVGAPIEIEFLWNENHTAAAINVDMPAGEFTFNMWSGFGMELTVDGVPTEMTGDGLIDPITFTVNVEEAGVVAMELGYPVGNYYNPEELELGNNSCEVEEYSQMGYWFNYTATEDCVFVLSMLSDNWFYSPVIRHADDTGTYPAAHYSEEDVVVSVLVLELKAGDVLILQFGTPDYAAATIKFNVATYAVGAPIEIEFLWNENHTAAAINVDMPAGEFTFDMWSGFGMELTVDGVPTEMTGDGLIDPITFTVNNEEAGVVAMELGYPVGSYYNPEELELGNNSCEVEEYSQMGYWYNYTATEDCVFVLSMLSDNWFYSPVIRHADGTGSYPAAHYSEEDVVVSVLVLELKAGDVLILQFGTPDYAAATIEFEAMTYAGTEEDPIMVQFNWDENYTAATLNIDLPAGEFVFGTRGLHGTVLTANGEEIDYVVSGSMRNPDLFILTNDGESNAIFELALSYPPAAPGTLDNPDVIELGEHTVEVGADNMDGHYFSWTAEEDGTLTIVISSEMNWYLMAWNNGNFDYEGIDHWSGDHPGEDTFTIEVKAGDEIIIVVNVYDDENGLQVAGEVTVALTFAP